MDILLILDRQNGQHLAGEVFLRDYYAGESITVKDMNGVTKTASTTWIGTLDANKYSKIHVLVVVDTAGGTGELASDQYAALIPKLLTSALPDALSTGTCQTNATATNIILAAGEVTEDDEFVDDFIVTAGTTAIARIIADSTTADDTVVVATTTVAVTDVDTYDVYAAADIALLMPIYTETYEAYEVFTELYPLMNHVPVLVEQMNGMPAAGTLTATADSAENTDGVATLTDTGNFTADAYDDGTYYLAIRSATKGAGQILRVVSNTADKLFLEEAWEPIPTGTIIYELVDRRTIAISTYLLQFAFRFLVSDPSENDAIHKVMKMVSNNEVIEQTDEFLLQDIEALEEFKLVGQGIMRSLGMGITS